jgi:hypothetical protein
MPPKGQATITISWASVAMRSSKVVLPEPRSPTMAKTPPPGALMRSMTSLICWSAI